MSSRSAITVRLPDELLAEAREAKSERESLNDLVVEALEHEVRRRQGWKAYEEIGRLSEKIFRERGAQPDSQPLIRALRDGEGRRD